MIGVKPRGVRGGGHFSAEQMDCKPTCSKLLPTTQQLCNVRDNQEHGLRNSTNNFQIKQELQSDNDEDNPAHHNFCPASSETKQHFKTEESHGLPLNQSVERLSEVVVKQEQDGGLSQPKGLLTSSPQRFGHQVTGVEAVDNRSVKIEKDNADKFTINHTNVKEEMESYDGSMCDPVYQAQPVNTCDGNVENHTSAIITSVQSEENVEGVVDIGGRSNKMEESDEDLEMTVESEESIGQKRVNWLSKVGENEDGDSPHHEICNDDLNEQDDASQAKTQDQQELREDSSFGVMTVNGNKEEEDGGISERKTRELSSKDKKSDKQPSNLCAENFLGRKSGDSMQTSLESSRGQHKKKARHECDVCGYSTNQKTNLTRHMSKHSEERPFICDICNKSFKLKHHLQEHKSLHSGDKQFQCDVCGYSTNNRPHLIAHMRVHTKEKPYVCDICNTRFTEKRNLQRHKSLHSRDKQFLCDVCGYSTHDKSNLTTHTIKHSEEKPYICDICNKRFKHNSHLNVHKRLHSGDERFQCDICDKTFTQKGSLQVHKRLHSGDRSFQCDICGRRFSRTKHVNRHLRTHTGM